MARRRVRWLRVLVVLVLLPLALLAGAGWLLLWPGDTDHTDAARCRRVVEARALRRAIRDRLSGDCLKEVDEQSAAIGLVRAIVTSQPLYRAKSGRWAAGLDELVDAGLMPPVAPDGYTFLLWSDGATWSLVARPSCEVCTVGQRATLEAGSASAGTFVVREPWGATRTVR